MVTREHPSHLRAHAQETWRQIFKEELRMFDTEAAWADFVRSTLTSARELGDAVERSGECPTEHLQCAAPPRAASWRSYSSRSRPRMLGTAGRADQAHTPE